MEFLDPKFKKRHTRMLFLGYGLIAILIASLSALFVLEARGYYISRGGEIVRNSLLLVDSHPNNAEVYIDGKLESDRTASRLVLPEGEHFVEVAKAGYKTWQHTVELVGGSVAFAKYPFLYPENPNVVPVKTYQGLPVSSQSPDRRYLIKLLSLSTLSFDYYDLDLREATEPEPLTFRAITNQNVASIEFLDWANNGKYVLTKFGLETGLNQYWLLDVEEPSESIRVTTNTNRVVNKMKLVDRKAEQIDILYSNGELVRYQVDNATTDVIAIGVYGFTSHSQDLVMFARANNSKTGTDVVVSNNFLEYKLVELPTPSKLGDVFLQIAEFERDWYYGVATTNEPRFKIYQNPLDDLVQNRSPELILNAAVESPRGMKFSTNVRFLAVAHANGLVVFDNDELKPYRYQISGLETNYKPIWMDGHRLVGIRDGFLTIWDFDSLNMNSFTSIIDSKQVYFDKNYDYLYSYLNRNNTQSVLQQTQLLTNDDL